MAVKIVEIEAPATEMVDMYYDGVQSRGGGGRRSPHVLSAARAALLPSEPEGPETSQLAGPKAGATGHSGMRGIECAVKWALVIILNLR